ncbi:glycosyltransferase [Chlorogloeopsis sp. ULAP02]|uniref:glycosyltransferase family 39 protein n=1 Tax=Chlorogloeopsis sp. ULAP02 TaxID=3107926 RepID=UPI0031354976
MTAPLSPRWLNLFLLLIWLVIAIGLRLINLTAKPPWTDEFSTLVFSLGNSFLPVPLNEPITIDILLQPLQPQPTASIQDVLANLFSESNHPPLYFVLTHLWMKLFPTQAGLVSLWGARSLAAIFGALSIPAIYALSWVAFRSRLISHLAAAMMAVSPYGIFLAQEARHYTLAILWVIASLTCLVVATRHIHNRIQLPIWLSFLWIVINALGIATHYFFTLTLCTEAMVLIFLAWQQNEEDMGRWGGGEVGNVSLSASDKNASPRLPLFASLLSPPWLRIYAVAVGTAVAGIVWLPVFLQNTYGDRLVDWIQSDRVGIAWISPIFQALAAWVTMFCLLPVESSNLAVAIASGLVMLIFLIWATPILWRGLRVQLVQPQTRLTTQVLAGVVVGAIALFFLFTYFLNIDLTRGARYNFVYFPAVIVLLGASLAICWHPGLKKENWGIHGKVSVVVIWIMGLLSAITVICDLGYQKYYRPDLFVQLIQKTSQVPVLIATTQKTHVQIGEMMGVAREFKLQNTLSASALFLLAHQDQNSNTSTIALQNTLKGLPRPLDLWLVNFFAAEPEEVKNCAVETRAFPAINGYKYKLYHCP